MKKKPTGIPLARKILALVSKLTNVPLVGITGASKEAHFVQARTMAMDLIHRFSGLSMVAIGQVCERDRITVSNAVERSKKLLAENPEYKKTFDQVKEMVS